MKKIDGVGIYLLVNNEQVKLGDDGYAGQLDESDSVVLGVITGCNDIIGISVDGRKNVEFRRNLAPQLGLGEETTIYRQNVTMKFGEKTGVWYTEYPRNHLRLLDFAGPSGSCRMWEITLISQGGKFFVTVQDTYEQFSCYRDENGRIACPQFPQWPQMITFLGDLLLNQIDDLPPLSEYQPKTVITAPDNKEFGCVVWWNSAQGLGMAAVDKSVSPNGMARIHWSQLASRTENGLAYLETGELIRWQATREPHQKTTRNTQFVCELVGVELVA